MTKVKHLIIPDEILINKIHFLRGQKVILARDLAGLYGVQAIRLREQVKRNPGRFPSRFMFQLTKKETELMVAQDVIPSWQHVGGTCPLAFTEHGVLMVANILKSDEAVQMSVRIIEVFVRMREILMTNKDILLQLEKMEKQVSTNSEDIRKIFAALRQLLNPPQKPLKKIGYRTAKG